MDGLTPEILVIRAWLEPASEPRLRIRMVAVRPGLADRQVLSSTAVEDACEALRQWLTSLGS